MNSEATVFSQSRCILFKQTITTLEAEQLLREFITSLGRDLAYNGVILGHIKVLARLWQPAAEPFFFLSLTRLDWVDITPSEFWAKQGCVSLDHLELDVNVLVFGYTMSQVEKVINNALRDLGNVL